MRARLLLIRDVLAAVGTIVAIGYMFGVNL